MQRMTIDPISDNSDATVDAIFSMQTQFPPKLRCTRLEVADYLSNEYVGFFLKINGDIAGYVLTIPHDVAVEKYQRHDKEFKKDSARYYMEQVAIKPEHRKGRTFLLLCHTLFSELMNRDINSISSHLVTTGGVNKILEGFFGRLATKRRMVYMPYFGKDPFEYVEASLKENL